MKGEKFTMDLIISVSFVVLVSSTFVLLKYQEKSPLDDPMLESLKELPFDAPLINTLKLDSNQLKRLIPGLKEGN